MIQTSPTLIIVDRLARRIEPLGYRVHLEPVASVV
jgi:hypothetical protein